jgi:hypothetical protein
LSDDGFADQYCSHLDLSNIEINPGAAMALAKPMSSRLRDYQMRTVLRASPTSGAGARRGRVVLAIIGLIIAVAASVPLVERWMDMSAHKAAALDSQYREMTNALVFGNALEHTKDHPMNRLYHERRNALLKAGYLKKRELRLRNRFESSQAAKAFFWSFASRFPGTEFQLRGAKPPATPVVVVYARDSDFLSMKWFIMQHDKAKQSVTD